jgi:hypothetical protein
MCDILKLNRKNAVFFYFNLKNTFSNKTCCLKTESYGLKCCCVFGCVGLEGGVWCNGVGCVGCFWFVCCGFGGFLVCCVGGVKVLCFVCFDGCWCL